MTPHLKIWGCLLLTYDCIGMVINSDVCLDFCFESWSTRFLLWKPLHRGSYQKEQIFLDTPDVRKIEDSNNAIRKVGWQRCGGIWKHSNENKELPSEVEFVHAVTAGGSEIFFASGVNFSIFTHFFVFLSPKLLKYGGSKGVNCLA